ncbi:MAG: hypothetical protein ABI543_15430 [Ignavibacteria bacterium]
MKILLAILLILISVSVYSQSDSVYRFMLPELKITQLENGKDVIYGFDSNENIFLVQDSTLRANPDRYKYKVLLSDIKKLSILDGNEGWRGAKVMGLVGGGITLVLGGIFTAAYGGFGDKAAMIIAIPAFILAGVLAGGLVGGILGSAIPHFEEYSKFSDDVPAKKEILKRIFKKHNLR